MTRVRMSRWLAHGLVTTLALSAVGQAPVSSRFSGPGSLGTEATAAASPVQEIFGDQDVFREIDDPHSGSVWLLLRDPERPGGPGRLVLAASESHTPAGATKDCVPIPGSQPVIHAGDALIVEEHTAVVDARLAAIALGSAARNAQLKARLRIGGKVVRVVALAPGRAALAPESEGSR